LSVEHPSRCSLPRGHRQSASCSRANLRLSKTKGTDKIHTLHSGQPFLLLRLGTAHINGSHRETTLNPKERCYRSVNTSYFHGNNTLHQRRPPRTTITIVGESTYIEFGQLRNYFKRKLITKPVMVDQRTDFPVHKITNL